MFTKKDLQASVDHYMNKNAGYFTALSNTFCIWRANTSRGIIRTVFSDCPQFAMVQAFMASQYFQSLSDMDEVCFMQFHNFIAGRSKEHSYSKRYIYGDSATAITIIKPWFDCLDQHTQNKILEGNGVMLDIKFKSAREQVAEFRKGAYDGIAGVGNIILAPIESISNVRAAIAQPKESLKNLAKELYARPAYTLASLVPGTAVGHMFGPAGVVGHAGAHVAVELNKQGAHVNQEPNDDLVYVQPSREFGC